MNWENLLNQVQIQESELLEKTKKKIEKYKNLERALEDAREGLENADEENYDEFEAVIDGLEENMAKTDKAICKEINDLQKEKSNPKFASSTEPQPANNQNPSEKKNADGKKDSSIGWLIFGGLALVATLGAVNLFKNK